LSGAKIASVPEGTEGYERERTRNDVRAKFRARNVPEPGEGYDRGKARNDAFTKVTDEALVAENNNKNS
jgi:hypothetical protein